jgi:YHS domain-containing protein
VQGPGVFLTNLGIELRCVVDPSAPAILDADHRVFVNWETYYFSRDAARSAFLQAPHELAGLVTDPVSRKRFRPTADSPRRDRGDHPFYFESEETATAFDADPERYETPMIGMLPKEDR